MSQTATTRYAIQYEVRDLSVPALVRQQMLTGRSRNGTEESVTFASLEQAQNAARVLRAERGVLRAYVRPVRAAR